MTDAIALYDRIEQLVDPAPSEDAAALDACGRFARDVLPPGRGAALEARGEFPAAEIAALAAHGLTRELVPHDQGGALEWSRLTRLCGRLSAHDLDFALCVGGAVLGGLPVLVAGDSGHRAAYFAPLLRGEVGGLGLTEWAHGSDLLAGETTATPIDAAGATVPDAAATHFRLAGAKAPINNGTRGACLVLLARTRGGADAPAPSLLELARTQSLFLLPRATPGLAPHPRFTTIGHRNMDLSGAVLRDVVVPRSAVMGHVGDGFVHARRALEISRSGVAQMAVGPTLAALAFAIDHARTRRLYGAPIDELGGVRLLLARSFARACVTTALARRTARTVARFAVPGRALSCAAKLLCPIFLEETIAECGTLLGARSLMDDLPFARLRRAAPVLAIFDGSSQLQLDELWRHAAAWRPHGSLTEDRARAVLRMLAEPVRTGLDAHGDDAGEVAATTPPAMLGALAASTREIDLAPIAVAAEAIRGAATRLRTAPQQARFAVSDAAARVVAIAAIAEARAMASTPEQGAALGAALALWVAEQSAPLAASLVEIAPDRAEDAHAVLKLATHGPRARDGAYAALAALV